jgi:hypothetical protein
MSQTSNPESPTIGTNALITELKSKEIMTRLADYMLDGTAPNATSSLINGVTIIIDFIRHNNRSVNQSVSMETDHETCFDF